MFTLRFIHRMMMSPQDNEDDEEGGDDEESSYGSDGEMTLIDVG
jgi:hypothetical protein